MEKNERPAQVGKTIPEDVGKAWDLRVDIDEMSQQATQMAYTLEMLVGMVRRQAEILDRATGFINERICRASN